MGTIGKGRPSSSDRKGSGKGRKVPKKAVKTGLQFCKVFGREKKQGEKGEKDASNGGGDQL